MPPSLCGGYLNRKELVKTQKIEKKYYELIMSAASKDLRKFCNKYSNYDVPSKYSRVRMFPFFYMMQDAMHYILEGGACVHTLNDMIKEAKKNAVNFEKEKLKEHKHD